MANRKLIDDFSSDEEPEEPEELFNLPVRFGAHREWVASWSAQGLQLLLANDNEARAQLMSLAVEFGDDPNPIFVGAHQLAWLEWRARVYWNGRYVDWIPIVEAYNVAAGNVPQFARWLIDNYDLPKNEDGTVTIKYNQHLVHTEDYDSTPDMAVTDAADAAFDYLLSIFNPGDIAPAETISDD
jgi:hypothetical protein